MLTAADKALGPGRAWQVEGSVGTQYTVIEWAATRYWSCNCPNWWAKRQKLDGHTINSPSEHHCKHIIEVLETPGYLAKGVKALKASDPMAVRSLGSARISTTTTNTSGRAALLDPNEEV